MELDYGKYSILLAIGVVFGASLLLIPKKIPSPKKRRENNPPLGDYKSIKEWE